MLIPFERGGDDDVKVEVPLNKSIIHEVKQPISHESEGGSTLS